MIARDNDPKKSKPDWRLCVVALVVCSTVFSLFATIPIYPNSPFNILGTLSAYKRGTKSSESVLTKHLTKLDVNYKVKRIQDFNELVQFYSRYTKNDEIAKIVIEESLDLNVPVNIAFALAWRESQFNPRAVSLPNRGGTRDWGLFQLNDGHRKNWTRADFFDIRKNTRSALAFLKLCIKEMGDLELALAAYNAGIHGVRTRGVPTATKKYVNAILSFEKKLDLEFTLFYLKKGRHSSNPL
jgi:hypothetical protein